MTVALVTALAAVGLSAAGMHCNKMVKEGGKAKHWMNAVAGICHFVTGT